MVVQVRLAERTLLDGVPAARNVFAFGHHPEEGPDDAHAVTAAVATGNRVRIVIDELLVGNALEEVQCRYPVDDDDYARIPDGATPDDVARCAVGQDALAVSCSGARALCLCALDGGCPSGVGGDGQPRTTPKGAPVGVLDTDLDGGADGLRLIDGAAVLTCGGAAVPLDRDASFWTPSGNQQKVGSTGFDALGPAIVLVPSGALPSGATCGVSFASDVVDKDGQRVCAPADGDRAAGCTPGDTSAIAFTVEAGS